jgi:hypothetical protein
MRLQASLAEPDVSYAFDVRPRWSLEELTTR